MLRAGPHEYTRFRNGRAQPKSYMGYPCIQYHIHVDPCMRRKELAHGRHCSRRRLLQCPDLGYAPASYTLRFSQIYQGRPFQRVNMSLHPIHPCAHGVALPPARLRHEGCGKRLGGAKRPPKRAHFQPDRGSSGPFWGHSGAPAAGAARFCKLGGRAAAIRRHGA